MNALVRRIQKLEVGMSSKTDPSAIAADLTWDELNVWLLVLSHLAVQKNASNYSAEEIEEHKATIEKIEAEIRRCVLKRLEPGYQRHIDWVESMWRQNHGAQGEYVPALLNDEYDGIGMKSEIMERRRAVRAEPLIAALLKVTKH